MWLLLMWIFFGTFWNFCKWQDIEKALSSLYDVNVSPIQWIDKSIAWGATYNTMPDVKAFFA